jgi:hypothetical protein
MAKVQTNLKSLLAGVDVPVTNELVIVVEREEIPHLRLTHETFCFREDGCVLMPEGTIEAFAAFANAGAPMRMAHLAVVGHALDDASEALAKERAENVMAFASDRRWAEHAFAHANDHEIQRILTWAARTCGIDCDPQGIDGAIGKNSREVLLKFRIARGIDDLSAGETKVELQDWLAIAALYAESIVRVGGMQAVDFAELRKEWQVRDPKCIAAGTTWTREKAAMTDYVPANGSGAVVDVLLFPDYANPWYSGEQGIAAQAIFAEPIFRASKVEFSSADQPPDLGKNTSGSAKKKKKKTGTKPGKSADDIKKEEQAMTYARYVEVVDEMNRMLDDPQCWDDQTYLAWAEEREAIWDYYVALGGQEAKLHDSASEIPVEPEPETGYFEFHLDYTWERTLVNTYNLAFLSKVVYLVDESNKEKCTKILEPLTTPTGMSRRAGPCIELAAKIDGHFEPDYTRPLCSANESAFVKVWVDASEEVTNSYTPILRKSQQAYRKSFFEKKVENWIDAQAVVLVNDDQVIISFRGTQETEDFATDFTTDLVASFEGVFDPSTGKPVRAHRGFLAAYESLAHGILERVQAADPSATIFITGHSLGGAMACACACDFRRRFPDRRITLYTYGQPRLGDSSLAENFADTFPYFRLRHVSDLIADVPITFKLGD